MAEARLKRQARRPRAYLAVAALCVLVFALGVAGLVAPWLL